MGMIQLFLFKNVGFVFLLCKILDIDMKYYYYWLFNQIFFNILMYKNKNINNFILKNHKNQHKN